YIWACAQGNTHLRNAPSNTIRTKTPKSAPRQYLTAINAPGRAIAANNHNAGLSSIIGKGRTQSLKEARYSKRVQRKSLIGSQVAVNRQRGRAHQQKGASGALRSSSAKAWPHVNPNNVSPATLVTF